MKTAIVIPQRSVEYNVFVGTPEVLFEFYTEVNKLTGLPRYRHMGRARMVHIFQEIVMKTRKKHVEMGANMILADLLAEKKIVH
jgi:hypothetical protein